MPTKLVICFFLALVVVGCLALLFFHRLGDRDLWSSHEARAAQDAQSILDSGDWVLPRLFDRRPELQKPPLYYWLVAAAAWLTGGRVDAWAVRLPAALAAVACVLGLYLLGRARGRPTAGLIAAAVLATAFHFTWLARVGRIDMPLTLAVGVALAGYYQGQCRLREPGTGAAWPWFLLAYLAAAAGVLLKGPIGLVLPGGVALVHLLVGRPRTAAGSGPKRSPLSFVHAFGLWWGLPLVLVLSLPWFFCANVRTGGEFFRVFFWYHNVERGFGGSGKLAVHPWWFYGPRLAVDFLPWTPALVAALWSFGRTQSYRRDPEARFGLVWLGTMVALLSAMKFKRADYLLPAYPGAALFVGCVAERWLGHVRASAPTRLRRWSLAAGALTVALVVGGWGVYLEHFLPAQEAGRGYRRFAQEIRRRVPAPGLVLLFRTKPHALTFHLGRPVDTLLEWENLDWWAGRPDSTYVIMPPHQAREWPQYLKSGRLEEVCRSTEVDPQRRERPLILLRTRPRAVPRAR